MTVVQHGVADEDKDDAGNKGLADFQQARGCGHVASHLTWTCLADANLAHVSDGGQAGEDGWHNPVVADLTWTCGAFEVVQGEDDGGGQAEQGSITGKGDREVLPGNRCSSLKTKQLHQDDEQSPGETEGPAEDAPVSSAMKEPAAMYGNREGHAGEDHGCQPSP